jgi:hypothetical protein
MGTGIGTRMGTRIGTGTGTGMGEWNRSPGQHETLTHGRPHT